MDPIANGIIEFLNGRYPGYRLETRQPTHNQITKVLSISLIPEDRPARAIGGRTYVNVLDNGQVMIVGKRGDTKTFDVTDPNSLDHIDQFLKTVLT